MKAARFARLKLWCKRLLFAVAALITLLALVLAVEHYRAKRLWIAYQAKLVDQGEQLLISDYRPPSIPEEQNFAMTPLLRPLTDYTLDVTTGETLFRDPDAIRHLRRLFMGTGIAHDSGPGWRLGQMSNLASWQQAARGATNSTDSAVQALRERTPGTPAEDLLFLLGEQQAELDELRTAVRRPAANFHPPADSSLGSWSVRAEVVKKLSRTFQLAALSELSSGQTEAAAADVVALFRLADLGARDPLLIEALIRFSLLEAGIQPLWEGLAQHRWTDGQLREFEQALSQIQPIKDMLHCLHGERAYSLNLLDNLPSGLNGPPAGKNWRRALIGAMIYQNQRHVARNFQDVLFPAFDPSRGTVDIAALGSAARPQRRPWALYSILADQLLPALLRCGEKAARTQATVNLAHLAVALERFHLVHGAYPQDLPSLCPDFLTTLPPDPVTGEPPVYRIDAEGPTVYYRGLDGKDEGGRVTVVSNGHAKDDLRTGDWVWQYKPVTQTHLAR